MNFCVYLSQDLSCPSAALKSYFQIPKVPPIIFFSSCPAYFIFCVIRTFNLRYALSIRYSTVEAGEQGFRLTELKNEYCGQKRVREVIEFY